jgi:hypothetical protein
MIFDLRCPPQALRAAAEFSAMLPRRLGVTLTAADGQLTIRQGLARRTFPAGPDATGQMEITPQALQAAAAWARPGEGMADVYLLVDDRMLLVGQGDDRTGFDTGGEPASEEYLAVAPLDRPGSDDIACGQEDEAATS